MRAGVLVTAYEAGLDPDEACARDIAMPPQQQRVGARRIGLATSTCAIAIFGLRSALPACPPKSNRQLPMPYVGFRGQGQPQVKSKCRASVKVQALLTVLLSPGSGDGDA